MAAALMTVGGVADGGCAVGGFADGGRRLR
jgi:hypothetical protein